MDIRGKEEKITSGPILFQSAIYCTKCLKMGNLTLNQVFEVDYGKSLTQAEEILDIGSNTCVMEYGLIYSTLDRVLFLFFFFKWFILHYS